MIIIKVSSILIKTSKNNFYIVNLHFTRTFSMPGIQHRAQRVPNCLLNHIMFLFPEQSYGSIQVSVCQSNDYSSHVMPMSDLRGNNVAFAIKK